VTGPADKSVRVLGLHDEEERPDFTDASPAERLAVMWQLTVDAWTFMGEADRVESPFQRDAVRISRGRG